MKLDRPLQQKILKYLRAHYPEPRSTKHDFPDELRDHPLFQGNMHYLMEHELIEGLIGNSSSCQGEVRTAKITAEGLDFLEDDGGLSAILRTVTVKFDPDDLRQLLAAKINQIDLPAPQKKTLTDRLQDLPADLLKGLLLKLVECGLAHGPAAIQIIQKYLAQAGGT